MKYIKNNQALSDIVGIVILLGISVSLFSVVQLIVLNYPFEPSPPTVDLVGHIVNDNIIIEHQGGESISLDSKILISIEGQEESSDTASDLIDIDTSDSDDMWEIGEFVSYPITVDYTNKYVKATVVDVETNSIIMIGVLQGGNI
jgi:hypothetical protein